MSFRLAKKKLKNYGASALIKDTHLPNNNSNRIRRQYSRLLLESVNSGKRSFQKEVLNSRKPSLRNKQKLLTSLLLPVPEVETSSVISSDSVVYMGTLYNSHPGFGVMEVVDLTKSSSNITVVKGDNRNENELMAHETHLSLDKRNSIDSIHQSNTDLSSHPDSQYKHSPTKKRLIRRRCCFKDDTISTLSDSTDL